MKVQVLILTAALLVGCSKEAFQAYDPSKDSKNSHQTSALASRAAADLCQWENFRRGNPEGRVLVYRSVIEFVNPQPYALTSIIEKEILENSELRVSTRETNTTNYEGIESAPLATELVVERADFEASCRENAALFSLQASEVGNLESYKVNAQRIDRVEVEAGSYEVMYTSLSLRVRDSETGLLTDVTYESWVGIKDLLAGALIKSRMTLNRDGIDYTVNMELTEVR